MTEKQLIAKIKELQQIKPSNDWVILTKKQILGDYATRPRNFWELFPKLIFKYKPAFGTLAVLAILFWLFGFAQN